MATRLHLHVHRPVSDSRVASATAARHLKRAACLACLLTVAPQTLTASGQVVADANQAQAGGLEVAPRASKRTGRWQGGAPAINKGAAGALVYFTVKSIDGPVAVASLQFEGIRLDDARVLVQLLDGAEWRHASQRTAWRLPPGTASELTLDIVLDDAPTLLSVYVEQGGQGSARAFALPKRPGNLPATAQQR